MGPALPLCRVAGMDDWWESTCLPDGQCVFGAASEPPAELYLGGGDGDAETQRLIDAQERDAMTCGIDRAVARDSTDGQQTLQASNGLRVAARKPLAASSAMRVQQGSSPDSCAKAQARATCSPAVPSTPLCAQSPAVATSAAWPAAEIEVFRPLRASNGQATDAAQRQVEPAVAGLNAADVSKGSEDEVPAASLAELGAAPSAGRGAKAAEDDLHTAASKCKPGHVADIVAGALKPSDGPENADDSDSKEDLPAPPGSASKASAAPATAAAGCARAGPAAHGAADTAQAAYAAQAAARAEGLGDENERALLAPQHDAALQRRVLVRKGGVFLKHSVCLRLRPCGHAHLQILYLERAYTLREHTYLKHLLRACCWHDQSAFLAMPAKTLLCAAKQ
jgi:hypothetical protein